MADILFVGYIYKARHMDMPPKKTRLRLDTKTALKIRSAMLDKGLEECVANPIAGVSYQPARKQVCSLSTIVNQM